MWSGMVFHYSLRYVGTHPSASCLLGFSVGGRHRSFATFTEVNWLDHHADVAAHRLQLHFDDGADELVYFPSVFVVCVAGKLGLVTRLARTSAFTALKFSCSHCLPLCEAGG